MVITTEIWKIVKLVLSKKIKFNERIALIENKEIIKTEKGTAKVLNGFFSNIFQTLDIQQYNVDDPICENINDPLLKAIFTEADTEILKRRGRKSALCQPPWL